MSGMYTMLQLTQVLKEGERGETGEKKRKTRTILYVSLKNRGYKWKMFEKVSCLSF